MHKNYIYIWGKTGILQPAGTDNSPVTDILYLQESETEQKEY